MTMQSIERKPVLNSVLKTIEQSQEQRLEDAYEQALTLLEIGFQEKQKRDEALVKKLFFAHELSNPHN